MTLLELQAIRALSDDYVREGTSVAIFGGYVVAMTPHSEAIIYKDGNWQPINLYKKTTPDGATITGLTTSECERLGIPTYGPTRDNSKTFEDDEI